MKISEDTLKMLKWMTTVNGGIKIDEGSMLYSKSESQAMCCVCQIKEKFPKPFVTTNLTKFLSLIDIVENPEFEFEDKYVTIGSEDGKSKIKFFMSDPALVNQSNKIPKEQKDIAIKFHFNSEDLGKVYEAAKVLNVSDITLKTEAGNIYMIVSNRAVPNGDYIKLKIGEIEDPDLEIEYYYRKQNLKLIPEYSYDVTVYSVGLTKFISTNSKYDRFEVFVVTSKEN